MLKKIPTYIIVRDENGKMKVVYPDNAVFFGWEAVAIAVAEAIATRIGTQAWDRVQGGGSQDVLSDKINELYERFQDAINRGRIGSALSRYGNAKLQVNNYLNDPSHRQNTLDFAENEAGYAMLELQKMGLFALHTWLISAELYMTILQERLKITSSPGAQRNINDHYNNMVTYQKEIDEEFRRDFHYCWFTRDGKKWLGYCGMDPVHIFTQAELDAQSYVATSSAIVDKLKSIIIPLLLQDADKTNVEFKNYR